MNRVLVFSPGTIQDQLLLFPSLAALPSSQIDVVVPPAAKGLYNLCSHVHQAMTFELTASQGLADWSNLYGIAREQEYDAALTVSPSLPIRFLLWLLGINTRIGVTGGTGEFLLTHALPEQEHLPRIYAFSDLFKVLKTHPVDQISLTIPDHAARWSHAAYTTLGLDSEGAPILLYDELEAPQNASYPLESWSSVIRGIRDRHRDLPIVLLGTPSNQTWIEQMQEQLLGISVIQTQNLEQAAAVISRSKALISSNTASLYLGLGTRSPLVGLFGAHKPDQYLPLGDRVIGLRASSGDIQDIAPIQVIESVNQLLESANDVSPTAVS